jgi:hypothetical protein
VSATRAAIGIGAGTDRPAQVTAWVNVSSSCGDRPTATMRTSS